MDDIVEQLRKKSRKMARIDRAEIPDNEGYKPEDYLWFAAADEIERLKAEIELMKNRMCDCVCGATAMTFDQRVEELKTENENLKSEIERLRDSLSDIARAALKESEG